MFEILVFCYHFINEYYNLPLVKWHIVSSIRRYLQMPQKKIAYKCYRMKRLDKISIHFSVYFYGVLFSVFIISLTAQSCVK